MRLEKIAIRLERQLQLSLPGKEAHEPMRARPLGNDFPSFVHSEPPRPGGVLIVLYEEEGKIKFPLIKRQDYPGAHSGQISLPGGKSEAGESPVQTALREAEEEIGIGRDSVQILGTLSEFYVIPSNFLIVPVVAVFQGKPVYRPDIREVARVIEGDLDVLLDEGAVREKEIVASSRYRMWAPCFEIEEETVWGATAMMLNEFRVILRNVVGA